MTTRKILWVGGVMLLPFMCNTALVEAKPKRRGRVIRLSDVKIVGKRQMPQAFYVLSRAPLDYEGFSVKQSFLKKVVRAVKKKPF